MKNSLRPAIIFACVLLPVLLSTGAWAQQLGHGNGALQIFDAKGMENSPRWVQIWVYIMLASFVASLFFVRRHVEARWVAGGFFLGMAAMQLLLGYFKIPPYSGLIASFHLVFWLPALHVLLRRRPFLKSRSLYSWWTGLITFVIAFSFVFDIRDAFLYWQNLLTCLDHLWVFCTLANLR